MEADAQNHGQGAPPAAEVPQHVAIIMDGNGRWARQHGMPRLAGHRAGTENIRRILRALAHHGVRYVTLFAFSTENWGRPQGEVTGLLEILQQVIQEEVEALHHENVRILHLGHRSRLPSSLAQSIDRGAEADEAQYRPHPLRRLRLWRTGRDTGRRPSAHSRGNRPRAGDRRGASPPPPSARRARPGPDHPHRRGAAAEQLPHLASRVQRVLLHCHAVARLR